MQSIYRKIQTRKNPYLGTFHEVKRLENTYFLSVQLHLCSKYFRNFLLIKISFLNNMIMIIIRSCNQWIFYKNGVLQLLSSRENQIALQFSSRDLNNPLQCEIFVHCYQYIVEDVVVMHVLQDTAKFAFKSTTLLFKSCPVISKRLGRKRKATH